MDEFSFTKTFLNAKKRRSVTGSHIAYTLFVLLCLWAGSQMIVMLINTPDVFEHLIQLQDASRPRVEMGLAVGTLFGLLPFLFGCFIIGITGLVLRHNARR